MQAFEGEILAPEKKAEIRMSKSETNPKPKEENAAGRGRVFFFGFRVCFGFRYSGFGFPAQRASLQLDRPVGVFEERLPRLVLGHRQLLVEHRAALRLLRLAD